MGGAESILPVDGFGAMYDGLRAMGAVNLPITGSQPDSREERRNLATWLTEERGDVRFVTCAESVSRRRVIVTDAREVTDRGLGRFVMVYRGAVNLTYGIDDTRVGLSVALNTLRARIADGGAGIIKESYQADQAMTSGSALLSLLTSYGNFERL